tara:strand:+ start:1027 stop:2154 length:1128 start_codon:yes stop_codon:yes gene_type:complete
MTLQTSRFQGQEIVNSFNIFVDTEKSSLVGDKTSTGDDTKIHFEGQTIEAKDGELIRISLLNFTMFNNTYMINQNNGRFNIKGTANSVAFNDTQTLTNKNYNNLKDIATDFATVVSAYLVANSSASSFTQTTVLPNTTSMASTDNRLLDILLTANTAHNITDLHFHMPESVGDSYTILGGLRQDDTTNTNFDSLKVTVASTTVRIQGFFPMQRMSDPYVYLRCNNAQNGLEMSVLSNDRGRYNSDVINSDILGKMFKDVEFIDYNSATGDEYFLNLQQRKLSNLRLFLTDSKGRKLGRLSTQRDLGTAAGLGSGSTFESQLQNTEGNLYFTAVLKVDIVKVFEPLKLESVGIKPPPRARESQSVLTWADYGRPKH